MKFIFGLVSGIVISVFTFSFFNMQKEYFVNEYIFTENNLQPIGTAFKLYKLDNFIYPTYEQGLDALIKKPTTPPIPNNYKDGGYLEFIPNDPWGNKLQFIKTKTNNITNYFVMSFGKDGLPGGYGPNKDVYVVLYQE